MGLERVIRQANDGTGGRTDLTVASQCWLEIHDELSDRRCYVRMKLAEIVSGWSSPSGWELWPVAGLAVAKAVTKAKQPCIRHADREEPAIQIHELPLMGVVRDEAPNLIKNVYWTQALVEPV